VEALRTISRDVEMAAASAPAASAPAAAAAADLESAAADAADGGLAAEAELHRLNGSSMTAADVRQALHSVERAVPFALLFAALFVLLHVRALATLALGTAGLSAANRLVRAEVARKAAHRRGRLLSALLLLAGSGAAVAALGGGAALAALLLLFFSGGPPGVTDNWVAVMLTTAAADLLARHGLALLKTAAVLLHPASSTASARRRGKLLTALDYAAALHRAAVPARLWLRYFWSGCGVWGPLAVGLSAVYLVIKAVTIAERASLALAALREWRRGAAAAPPTAEQLAAAPPECAVCQEALRAPARLTCGHIYCQDCIGEWLEREATCPMCRAQVRKAALRQLGDGGTSLFPILF
jgi:MFS family permease